MKYLVFMLACTAALGQEGRAVRPVPKPDCAMVTTLVPGVKNCTFGAYRFTYQDSPEPAFTVARMESGNYSVTSLAASIRDPRALDKISSRLQKDAKRRKIAGEPCDEINLLGFDNLILKFGDNHAYFVLGAQACNARAKFSFGELHAMLK